MNEIVLGLGFGDEGKGLVTDWLCQSSSRSLVVRFSGGCNAGHTVVAGSKRHVFSHFGSGTLVGAPTYWSRFCPVSPPAFLNERAALKRLGVTPTITLHPNCPLTTPWDVFWNQALEIRRGGDRHGSVGVGLGATVERQSNGPVVEAMDLLLAQLPDRLAAVRDYYQERTFPEYDEIVAKYPNVLDLFVELVRSYPWSVDEIDLCAHDGRVVFEGSQGLLLDQDLGQELGFFPHLTRANTSSVNAMKLVQEHGLDPPIVLYVTRSYLTRHGRGPLPNEYDAEEARAYTSLDGTNRPNPWQERLRVAPLDYDLMRKAVDHDRQFHPGCGAGIFMTWYDVQHVDESRLPLMLRTVSRGPAAQHVSAR